MYGGGEDSEETQEDSLSVEMIVRGIPKTMKTRAEALLASSHIPVAENVFHAAFFGAWMSRGVHARGKEEKL